MEDPMPTTFHNTKEDLVDTLWQKMIEVGANEGLIAFVSAATLHLDPDSMAEYDELVDKIIELSWKRGAYDLLTAIELGAIKGVFPKQSQGDN